jgi:hypothetical protein
MLCGRKRQVSRVSAMSDEEAECDDRSDVVVLSQTLYEDSSYIPRQCCD